MESKMLNIIGNIYGNVVKIVNGVAYDKKDRVVEIDKNIIEFESIKTAKINELKQSKEKYLQQPIRVGNKLFYGHPEAYDKYLKAYNLGVKKGVDGGKVILIVDHKPKWVYVTKKEIEEYFLKQEDREYRAEYYLGKLLEIITEAKTKEEIEQISWENPE